MTAAPNKLIGGLLADFIAGGEGADLIRGEQEGSPSGTGDTLLGNEGSDQIFPGLGANVVDAGQGAADSDTINYSGLAVASGVVVTLNDGNGTATNAVADTLGSVESVRGTPNGDSIQVLWNGVASLIRSRGGDDFVDTSDGDALDTINAGTGVDSCSAEAGDTKKNCP